MIYPEHEKLAAVADESQAIGEFLDLGPYHLAEYCKTGPNAERMVPVGRPISDILAAWFGIDLRKLELEKRAMLAELRWLNSPLRHRPVTRAVEWPAEWRQ